MAEPLNRRVFLGAGLYANCRLFVRYHEDEFNSQDNKQGQLDGMYEGVL